MLSRVLDVNQKEIPQSFPVKLDECLEQGDIPGTYQRHYQVWSLETSQKLNIELLWHTHDGQSDRAGFTDLYIAYIDKRTGKYI